MDDHFFRVEIRGYNPEISELLNGANFKNRLRMMLPLKYSPEFTYQKEIKDKYKEFMGESIDKYSFSIKLDKEPLYKLYNNDHILESKVQFWELSYPSKNKGVPGDKIGILWFTFNKVMTASEKDEPYGILVRSKNMLMGDNDSLANAVLRSKTEYITTYRELTQTLRGVYGEMLINSPKLHDNARRDWFKLDMALIDLRNIIVDFMRRLYEYRYIASNYFNGKEKSNEKLIKAFTELTNHVPGNFIIEQKTKKEKENFEFANEDIPREPIIIKRFYERLAKCLREYYSNKGELQEFLKIRALLKKGLNNEPKS